MAGLLCLQGGREFTADCREMDAAVLRQSDTGGVDRPVVVLAGAARVGSDYRGACERAARHYRSLGASVEIVPDPRTDLAGALASLHVDVGLVVLPGGSPASLIDVLLGSTAAIGDRILELHADGAALSGASAGAMAMCEYCVLPERRSRRTTVTHGLGLAEGVALPHWEPGTGRWSLPDEVHLWGLPECGGVVVDVDGTTEAVGQGKPSFRMAATGWVPVIRAASDESSASSS
ncbi:MAG: Type 1 glutamine amidotransferase-like domain-containing protein [Actinomycetota bacterium]